MGVPAPIGVAASGRSPYYPADKANAVLQGTLGAVAATSPPMPIYGKANLWLWASFTTSLDTTAASLAVVLGSAGAIAAGASVNSPLVPAGFTLASTILGVLPTYTYTGKTKAGIAKITDLAATNFVLGATVSGYGIQPGTTVTAIDTPAIAPTVLGPGQRGTVSISLPPLVAPVEYVQHPFAFALVAGIIATGTDAAAVFTGASIVYNATVQLERSFDGGHTWCVANMGGSGVLAQWTFAVTGGVPISFVFEEPELQVLYRLNTLAYTPITTTILNYRISETGQRATTLAVP